MNAPRFALAFLVSVLAATGLAHAGWFELSLSNDTVQGSGGAHLGSDPDARFALGGRLLYDDEYDTRFGSFLAGFVSEPASVTGLQIGVGTELYVGKGDGQDLTALAIGASGSWAPERLKGLYFGGGITYAPGLMSWRDTESLLEWSGRAGFRFTPKIEMFVEYRSVEADFKDVGKRKLSRGPLVGFGGRF